MDATKTVTTIKDSVGEFLNNPFLVIGGVTVAGISALARISTLAGVLTSNSISRKNPCLTKRLREVAKAPALEIEAQLEQEEADLLRLLEEKRNAN